MKGNEGLKEGGQVPSLPLNPQVALLSPRLLNEAQPLADDDVIGPLVLLTHGLVFNAYRIPPQTPQDNSIISLENAGKAKNEPDFRFPHHYRTSVSWLFSSSFRRWKKESRMRRSVNSKIICDFMDPSLSTKVSKLCQHLHFNSFRKESRRFTYSWRMNRKRVQNDDRKKGLQRSKNLFVKWCVAFDAFLHFLNH